MMIDPENDSTRHNLERAKNSEAVMALITSGTSHEKNNNLSRALADYQEALNLDPESEKAQTALSRVKNLIAAEQFQQLMSSGFKALNEKDYNRARSSFLKARSFQPDSHEVKDALLQVDTAIRLARIEALRKMALAAESSEKWHEALPSYQEVLTIDNSIQFALYGKERSLKRKQLDESMNYYLEKPSVLESDHSLEKATKLLKEAKQIEPQGPRLTQQLKRLDKLVTEAQIPVPVTIESDSLTEVVIYKVGKLGRFTIRELNLRPGTYTIVGARKGFKDVRQKIAVKAGEGPVHITLKCSEKI
jgi:tetratricopeptide (TPR) repeat protein